MSDLGHFYRSDLAPSGVLPPLRLGPHVFMVGDATRFTAIQATDFNLLARYLREGSVAIRAVLQQRQQAGFNMLRVWTLMLLAQYGIGDLTLEEFPNLYQAIPSFVALCTEYGLYVEFTAYTGINDPNHWVRLGNAARLCHPRPILELVNEDDVNHEPDSQGRVFNSQQYAPLAGLLCSHGSNGSGRWPITPYWDYLTFHTNDAPEWQRKVGHNAMEIGGIDHYTVLTNENTRYPDRDQSLPHAQGAAESAALLCAGSCFHSVHGKCSQEWTGIELDAAKVWAASARKVDLTFQQGTYHHAIELETPAILRAYQRILPDHRAYTALVPV